jgi:hypothetical protein
MVPGNGSAACYEQDAPMSLVQIEAEYRERFARQGLVAAADFLDLPGLVVSGHPERHVRRVVLAGQTFYLKREHRVSWLDRWSSFVAGLGFVSKSLREARLLVELRREGIAAPQPAAAGEDGQGRAFVLVPAVPGAVELRQFLRTADERTRRSLARQLGAALARLHQAGFDQPDLSAKHVLVDPAGRIVFLDWQRGRKRKRLTQWRRLHNWALLHATLADELASPGERLRCLAAYRRRLRQDAMHPNLPARIVARIQRLASHLLRRRAVRRMRAEEDLVGQGVWWLEGEALCVTEEFWAESGGRLPAGLRCRLVGPLVRGTCRQMVSLPAGRYGLLLRRRQWRPWAFLWSWCRQKSLVSPEVRRAGKLLRNRDVAGSPSTPGNRLLAFGQRPLGLGRIESFLLTEVAVSDDPRPGAWASLTTDHP